MLDKYKGIIFDLDGTLVDSMWAWEAIDREFLEQRGREFTNDFQEAIEGMSFTETCVFLKERYDLEESVECISEELVNLAMDVYSNRVKIKPHVIELLDYFKSRGIPMGVGTSNSKALAMATLEGNKISHYFETVNVSCEVSKGKPSPDIFLKVASILNIEPEHCLVFEDTMAGVQAAQSAGMDVIGIYDKVTTISEEKMKANTKKFIYDYKEIL